MTFLVRFFQKKKKKTFQSNNASVPEFGQVATPTVAQVATPTVIAQASLVHTSGYVSVSPGEKLEKFNGLNFKRWQQNMIFYLTTLNHARFLTKDVLQLKEDEHDIQVISAIEAWKHSNFLYRNYVLKGFTDTLYNVYYTKSSSKKLWESLDQKYKIKDAGAKKFIVGRFLDFKMVGSKTMDVGRFIICPCGNDIWTLNIHFYYLCDLCTCSD